MSEQLASRFPGVVFGLDVQIIGMDFTRIGQGTCIADHSWLNVCRRDGPPRLLIGRRVLVGRGSLLSAGGLLDIGDYCLLAPQVFISDADHIYANIAKPYMDQGTTAGRVIVEENCWFGVHAVVSGNIIIGRGSVVAANAVVTRDVPPFCVVAGVPARIIRMYNPATCAWEHTSTDEERERVAEVRSQTHLPTREEYRRILARTSAGNMVEPLVAGGGWCI